MLRNLDQSNTLNLNWNTLWQLVNSNTTSSWFMRKDLLIDGIHLSKIFHIHQEHVDLNHLAY